MLLENIKDLYLSNNIDYGSLFKQIKLFGDYEEGAYIDIFLPTYNRDSFTLKTLQYLFASLQNINYSYNVVCTSFNYSEEVKKTCLDNGGIYLYSSTFPKQHNTFSRALSFDLPFKYLKCSSNWCMFTDCDLLVTPTFMENTLNKLKGVTTWLQPYSYKRITNLTEEGSQAVFQSEKCIDLTSLEAIYPKSGAPGGCVIVSNNLYKSVGGYDPELFWGYGPEDAMFWVKLECMVGEVGAIEGCHVGGATYSNSETLYHLYHEPQWMKTRTHKEQRHAYDMQLIHDSFFALPYDKKLKLIEFKKELYGN